MTDPTQPSAVVEKVAECLPIKGSIDYRREAARVAIAVVLDNLPWGVMVRAIRFGPQGEAIIEQAITAAKREIFGHD